MYIGNEERSSGFLTDSFQEIERHIALGAEIDPEVSQVNVAWHLYHSLKVISGICDALTTSDPQNYKTTFSMSRLYCFTMGYIPRGAGQAPKSVRPPEVVTTEDLLSQLKLARGKLRVIDALDPNAHFEHPYFKSLNKGQTKRFLKIHTEHHLKIVRDILGK